MQKIFRGTLIELAQCGGGQLDGVAGFSAVDLPLQKSIYIRPAGIQSFDLKFRFCKCYKIAALLQICGHRVVTVYFLTGGSWNLLVPVPAVSGTHHTVKFLLDLTDKTFFVFVAQKATSFLLRCVFRSAALPDR